MTGRTTEGRAKCQRGSRGGPEKKSGWSPGRGLCSKIYLLCAVAIHWGLLALWLWGSFSSLAFFMTWYNSRTNSLLSLVACLFVHMVLVSITSLFSWTSVFVILTVSLTVWAVLAITYSFQKYSAPLLGPDFQRDLLSLLEQK